MCGWYYNLIFTHLVYMNNGHPICLKHTAKVILVHLVCIICCISSAMLMEHFGERTSLTVKLVYMVWWQSRYLRHQMPIIFNDIFVAHSSSLEVAKLGWFRSLLLVKCCVTTIWVLKQNQLRTSHTDGDRETGVLACLLAAAN